MSNIEQCEAELKPLLTKRNAMTEKLKQTRLCVLEKNKILLELRSIKRKSSESLCWEMYTWRAAYTGYTWTHYGPQKSCICDAVSNSFLLTSKR
jgi:hypothetical protein